MVVVAWDVVVVVPAISIAITAIVVVVVVDVVALAHREEGKKGEEEGWVGGWVTWRAK